MKQGIWGHALFLASKMDQRTYGQVMTRFANGLLQNDPLQTLYQLMSGRQPSCTTVSVCVIVSSGVCQLCFSVIVSVSVSERPAADAVPADVRTTALLHHGQCQCQCLCQVCFSVIIVSRYVIVCVSVSVCQCVTLSGYDSMSGVSVS